MKALFAQARLLMLRALIALPALLPALAHASPTVYDAFLEGSGIYVHDAATGNGAITGTLADSPFPVPTHPLSLLTVIDYSYDAPTNQLMGSFEFTSAADFGSTLVGMVSGSFLFGDFVAGGQLALDYAIKGGTGQFLRADGFLISLMDIVPAFGGFGDTTEVAVGQFVVPEPGTLALLSAGLLAGGLGRRRPQPLN